MNAAITVAICVGITIVIVGSVLLMDRSYPLIMMPRRNCMSLAVQVLRSDLVRLLSDLLRGFARGIGHGLSRIVLRFFTKGR